MLVSMGLACERRTSGKRIGKNGLTLAEGELAEVIYGKQVSLVVGYITSRISQSEPKSFLWEAAGRL
ncbi:hypothetical protein BVI1335_560003 [Burkholderia vietnamiensis]|nr:hypothetical protein BVI1335_560003 [Burkholderia vietnamiensis]